jgi:hypothetical protein
MARENSFRPQRDPMANNRGSEFAGLTNRASELLPSRLRFAQLKRPGPECIRKGGALNIELNVALSQREKILDPEQGFRQIKRL